MKFNSAPASGAGTRPSYAVDGTKFGARKVVQTTATGVKVLRNTTLPAALVASSHPYLIARMRIRTPLFSIPLSLVSAAGATVELEPYLPSAVGTELRLSAQGADRVTGADYLGAGVITLEAWTDGTNANIRIDNVLTSAAYAGGLTSVATGLGIGIHGNGLSIPADASFAFVGLCTAYPGDQRCRTERALLARQFPA